ncbi:MAG: hypothetical protein DHS20C05_03880 [Hyphococcus sp.]|nr:MAG: hypothetical protein DHS20C05_03880 [Marinicaulis sp.]
MDVPFTGRPTSAAAQAVLTFWFEDTKPYQWFRRSAQFDQTVRTRFGAMHEAACSGRLDVWQSNPHHCLALIIVLDQFSRNTYRDTPRAFAQDKQALAIANGAIRRRYDQLFDRKEKAFFYMPFMHSEVLAVQEKSVALYKARLPGTMNVPYAIEHRDIVKKFGRFPHRNKIMGRQSTPTETAFLKAGGFNP